MLLFYEPQELKLENILSYNSREYCRWAMIHPYQILLEPSGIKKSSRRISIGDLINYNYERPHIAATSTGTEGLISTIEAGKIIKEQGEQPNRRLEHHPEEKLTVRKDSNVYM